MRHTIQAAHRFFTNMEKIGIDEGERTQRFMRLALEEATRALNGGEIPVGCVIVKGDEVIATGSNRTNDSRNGCRHAEIEAIDYLVLQRGLDVSEFRCCELYVTCEPCIMCAAALSLVGIGRVYFGCRNERFGGNGSILSVHQEAERLSQHSYPIEEGLLKDEAIEIFQRFYMSENRRAPEQKRRRKRPRVGAAASEDV